MTTRQIKFTIGDNLRGYKTVEVTIDGGKLCRKILRGGLLDITTKNFEPVEISDDCLTELDALNIFAWEKNYSSESRRGIRWQMIYGDGDEIYRGRGEGAFPENFEQFADWLDKIFPEMEFVDRQRLERISIDFSGERLVIDRRERSMTLTKPNSNHRYDAGNDIKKIFNVSQKFFDGVERVTPDVNFSSVANFELTRHDGTVEIFSTPYTENFLPDLPKFIDAVRMTIDDLSAEIFTPSAAEVSTNAGKIILCKVQFPGSYKHYTYSTDDETLAVGDIVDVPVGRNNDVTFARIADIGYFDEYETPIPIERIKKIIGKHIADEEQI